MIGELEAGPLFFSWRELRCCRLFPRRPFLRKWQRSAKSFGRNNSRRLSPAIPRPVVPKVRGKTKVSFSRNASPMAATWTASPNNRPIWWRVARHSPCAATLEGPALASAHTLDATQQAILMSQII